MTRRKFFNNIVASVATLVTAHALPLQKVRRLIGDEDWVLNDVPYEMFKPEVNPAYVSAEYYQHFWFDPHIYSTLLKDDVSDFVTPIIYQRDV